MIVLHLKGESLADKTFVRIANVPFEDISQWKIESCLILVRTLSTDVDRAYFWA